MGGHKGNTFIYKNINQKKCVAISKLVVQSDWMCVEETQKKTQAVDTWEVF